MNFKKLILFFPVLMFSLHAAHAQEAYKQKQNNIWLFNFSMSGTFFGYDFNNKPVNGYYGLSPLNWPTGVANNWATESVCDAYGRLLFYTDGHKVFQGATNKIMPNGADIDHNPWGNGSGTTVVIPMIDSPAKYYLFTNERTCYGCQHMLYYSVVDMSLDSGRGDIVAGRKEIYINRDFSENLTAVAGNNCDYWLILHSFSNSNYWVYHITAAGIDPTPVISYMPISFTTGRGGAYYVDGLEISPNRKKLALSYGYGIEVCDFDPATGKVSNPVDINHLNDVLCVFSPDNTKLYTECDTTVDGKPVITYPSGTGSGGGGFGIGDGVWDGGPYLFQVLQYDLTSSTGGAIPWTYKVVVNDTEKNCCSLGFGDARLAPNGKIYCAGGDSHMIINYPDSFGTLCNPVMDSLFLQNDLYYNSTTETEVLGQPIPVVMNHDTVYHKESLVVCNGKAAIMTAYDTTGWDYLWNDYDQTHIISSLRKTDSVGTYVLTYHTRGCEYHIDSFIVHEFNYPLHIAPRDTSLCDVQLLALSAPDSAGASYLWQDSTTAPGNMASKSGTYWVTVHIAGCTITDTTTLQFIHVKQDLGPDTIFCKGQPIELTLQANITDNIAQILWSNGSTGASIPVMDTGNYWIHVSEPPCISRDTIYVGSQYCDCLFGMPSAFSPNGDGRNDLFRPVIEPQCPVYQYYLTIYNRWGQVVYISRQPYYQSGSGWDGTLHGVPAPIGTYMYVLEFEAGSKREKHYQKGDITLIR